MIHIMLDLETWGTDPGCDLRSIGACVFDPVSGMRPWPEIADGQCFYRATDNPIWERAIFELDERDERFHTHYDATVDEWRKYPLTRDPQTVQWWSKQSDEAQAAFADPVDLREALAAFTRWYAALDLQDVNNGNHGIRLWSHGPGFDPPILAAAYRAVGLPVPWHYRALRDTRTIFDLAGIEDHSVWLNAHPGPMQVPHHALDDAICQARGVCGAMARIGSVSDAQFEEIGGAMVNLSALLQRAGFLDNDHNHAAYERVVKLWQNAIGHPDGKVLRP